MKLFYSPGACSLSPHIVANELELSLEYVRVDLKKHKYNGVEDFYAVNPNGYVPLLELDDGNRLTEGPAIVQFLADMKPESGLIPANGSLARAQLQQSLNFLTSEIHQGFHAVFYAGISGRYGEASKQKLTRRYAWLDQLLGSSPFVQGENFTVADAYLFALTGWAKASWITTYINSGFSVEDFAHIQAWYERIRARPAVQKSLVEEGLG